jgi:hypothetical protein
MPHINKSGESKQIAPSKLWYTLSPAERERLSEVLIQIAEELITDKHHEEKADSHYEECPDRR